MPLYSTPARIEDFARSTKPCEILYTAWDTQIRRMISAELGHAYFGVLEDESGVPNPGPILIPWDAFPRSLRVWYGGLGSGDPDARADQAAEIPRPRTYYRLDGASMTPFQIHHRQQDEYCEWYTWTNADGRISRIALTCENPEYWTVLADGDRSLLLTLYKELLKTEDVQEQDLFWPHDVFVRGPDGSFDVAYRRDEYNPYNVWNIERGIVHLAHPSNSLAAEIHLAAQGAWRYPDDEQLDPRGLLCCGGHGRVERISDPRIAWEVNQAVRSGLSVGLADPVGLYIQPFTFELRAPDGRDVFADCVHFTRGNPATKMILRVEIAPPVGADYELSDLRLPDGSAVTAARIARRIGMGLFAVAKAIPGMQPKVVDSCTAFCCTHPCVPAYRATFSKAEDPAIQMCETVPADWWRRHEPTEAAAPHEAYINSRDFAAPDAVARPTRALF